MTTYANKFLGKKAQDVNGKIRVSPTQVTLGKLWFSKAERFLKTVRGIELIFQRPMRLRRKQYAFLKLSQEARNQWNDQRAALVQGSLLPTTQRVSSTPSSCVLRSTSLATGYSGLRTPEVPLGARSQDIAANVTWLEPRTPCNYYSAISFLDKRGGIH
ncbi:predicted protein [Histoplasma capsulatum G186AR]|uniref:Uncharacterized protein n=1 Tax=Ajellomyces capsulatus (strain G186AR / H82 / ATCC MYA-2454 / RMSCC 2432) TaxID=447093 RepID=C0NAR0_AJECG|nr:uncharacterized protein HCBG_00206 [Histoplasma capsulatum G186AR]EEH10751.1 predicted protein [Histoplasma capsulatum G186AR]